MPQIIVENITKTYLVDNAPIDAVRSVSLRIDKGDFISIVGHSGSGKTTLLSMIGGITRPSSGKVLFDGEDIYALASDRVSEYRCEKIGFMFQFASLLPILTVKENLLLPTVFRPRAAGQEAAKGGRTAAAWSASRTRSTSILRNCPADSSGGWRSPGPL